MEHSHPNRGNKRFYIGVILIAIGGVLILEKMNLIPHDLADVLISWKMLILGVGVLAFARGNRVLGSIFLVFGAFLVLPDLIQVPYEVRRIYWPVILVAVGVALLIKNKERRPKEIDHKVSFTSNESSIDNFDDFVIFGGREIFVTSQSLNGGKATSVFGGIEYDLRKAAMTPNGAVIDCVSIFGGCGFKVPMDWNVRNEVTTIFGAFTDKRGETAQSSGSFDPSKTLTIKGASIFGGIEIKHF